MQFSFSAEQIEFAAGLREMLEREFPASRLRAVWDDGSGHDPALWGRLAEMGVFAMMVPEADGGLGGDMVDTVLLIEELGRAAVPGPVIETAAVAAVALAGTTWAKAAAEGTVPVTAALLGERTIPHATSAMVLLTTDGDSEGVIAIDTPQFTDDAIDGIDGGRRLASLATGASDHGTRLAVDRELLVDIGALATAAALVGLSSRMLALAGDYARNRRQFGQPIGAFQAVKHLMADALLQVEFARPAVYRAAWSIANDQPDRTRDVSMAKALAADAAQKAARSALQVHGAIGYTWECDLHLYMKKAWALIPTWGSTTHHRRVVADAVLGPR